MLTEDDIKSILRKFPKFELCYEIITHKKVYNSNVILAIPEGKKCFAWFSSYNANNVCFILEINENNNITNVSIVVTSFTNSLALGTIFYGTMFKYNNINCFCIEDLYYYKGKSYLNTLYSNKLKMLKEILQNEMSQNVLIPKFTIFGLPLMSTDFNLLLKEIQSLPYKINQIKFRFIDQYNFRKIVYIKYYKPNSQFNRTTTIKNNITTAVFKITADIEPDIYNLFIIKNGIEDYYDTAFVPDYKTSVMMNGLFRNIKENLNLDAIEESDNEEEFEDNRDDKYVYLDRSFKIKCEYNFKFKRWCPVSLAGTSDIIISSKQLEIRN
ncbi:MAG: hypothetical protein WCJ54_03320 [Actinomycetota bacterium]